MLHMYTKVNYKVVYVHKVGLQKSCVCKQECLQSCLPTQGWLQSCEDYR